jgi:superfamily II DNA or RNA helicase
MVNFVRDKFNVFFETDDDHEREIIQQTLSIQNPGAYYVKSFRDGYWDGYNRFYTGNSFLHGHTTDVIKALEKSGVTWSLDNGNQKYLTIPESLFTEKLYKHQRVAVQTFFNNNYGIVKVPTRGGKTFIASECIRLAHLLIGKERVLFIVDSIDLFYQSVEEIASFLNIPQTEIGQLQGDKLFKPSLVNVAMVQTLNSILYYKKEKLNNQQKKDKAERANRCAAFLRTIKFLIVDEVHEYSSENRVKIITSCEKINKFLSLSATPYKSGNILGNMDVKGVTGGIIYEIHEEELIQNDVLVTNDVWLIMFEKFVAKKLKSEEETKYRYYLNEFIINNDSRNSLIMFLIFVLNQLKIKTLVLFNSVAHGKLISELSGCRFLSGEDDSDARTEGKQKFLKAKGKVLLASDIYKKGITLPQVQVLINVNGGAEKSLISQRKGRVLGKSVSTGKTKALIIDIIDFEPKYFQAHALNRVQVYEETHTRDQIKIFEECDVDFKDHFKNELIDYFEL